MKIIHFNKRANLAKIRINSLDDLWHLSKVISEGDLVTSRSERRIKLGGEGEKQRSERKTMTIQIKVSKIVFDGDNLRVQGVVSQGPESIALHSAHTLELTIGTEFKLEKSKWFKYQIDRLKQAESASSAPKVLLCVLDDEQANLAYLTASGTRQSSHLSLRLSKKRLKEDKKPKDIERVGDEIASKSQKVDKIILASPLFWNDIVMKYLKQSKPEVAKKVLLRDVSTGTKRGLHELVAGGAVEQVIKESQAAKAEKLVNNLLEEISKNGLAVYGLKEVSSAVKATAVKELLISETLMDRVSPQFSKIETLIDSVEQAKGKVHIIDKKGEAGRKLIGLSGIAGLLRFRI